MLREGVSLGRARCFQLFGCLWERVRQTDVKTEKGDRERRERGKRQQGAQAKAAQAEPGKEAA